MKIRKNAFGITERSFDTDTDTDAAARKAKGLRNPMNDHTDHIAADTDQAILRWPTEDDDDEDWHDYSPSAPWKAPGMRPEDFIR